MTKTLTEQWRDGTLESGFYYVTSGWSTSIEIRYLGNGFFEGNIKVISAVPSYDEFKELTQRVGRLELVNEVLEDVVQECNKRGLENKKLQEQLKSANNAMKAMLPFAHNYTKERIEKYLKKWNVK